MITHYIEGGCKETGDIRRVNRISGAHDVSVSLDYVRVGRVISRVDGWLRIILMLHHADAGLISVGSVGVTFDAEEMRSSTEVLSIAVGIL